MIKVTANHKLPTIYFDSREKLVPQAELEQIPVNLSFPQEGDEVCTDHVLITICNDTFSKKDLEDLLNKADEFQRFGQSAYSGF